MAKQNKYQIEYILGLIGGIGLVIVGVPLLLVFGLGVWFIGWGIGMIITSLNLKKGKNPRTNATWLLVCSIAGGGNLLGIIAGIMALVKSSK